MYIKLLKKEARIRHIELYKEMLVDCLSKEEIEEADKFFAGTVQVELLITGDVQNQNITNLPYTELSNKVFFTVKTLKRLQRELKR